LMKAARLELDKEAVAVLDEASKY